MTIELVTAPAALPVTTAEAKAHLRVDHTDEDTLIDGLIAAAVALVDGRGMLGRAMVTQTWAQWVGNSPGKVLLQMGPFQELVSVQYYDTDNALQTATLSDFDTRKKGDYVAVQPKTGFNWPSAYMRDDAIKITYAAGYGDTAADVPASVKQAMLLLIGHWYENRLAVSEVDMKPVPMAVEALIGAERVSWYG